MYLSLDEAAQKFGLSKARVRTLCSQGRIDGAEQFDGQWRIPEHAQKPADRRKRAQAPTTATTRSKVAPASSALASGSADAAGAPGAVSASEVMSEAEICEALYISMATFKNWVRLAKLVPDVDGKGFSRAYIESVVKGIRSGESGALKSRRNKKSITGKLLYKDYISTEHNLETVAKLLSMGELTEHELIILLANYAMQLFYQKNGIDKSFDDFFESIINLPMDGEFAQLIQDLLSCAKINEASGSKPKTKATKQSHVPSELLQNMMALRLEYVEYEDTLGFVYMSLRDIGERKQAGAYYTPYTLVDKAVSDLKVEAMKSDVAALSGERSIAFCDPCCGSGNFLMALQKRFGSMADLYGKDIDPISVCLTRINLYLTDPSLSSDYLLEHIKVGDTLLDPMEPRFDAVVGNPPWGSVVGQDKIGDYKRSLQCANAKGVESYDLFIEHSLSMLKDHGILSFVLPEAILNVASHETIRAKILDTCRFNSVSYIGNIFSGVQCPAIVLQLSKLAKRHAADAAAAEGPCLAHGERVLGCKVEMEDRAFTIHREREISAQAFSFNITDEEHECIELIEAVPKAQYLKDQASFALGIVTGNNKEFIASEQAPNYEGILKGSDIYRYSIAPAQNFIHFEPDRFQQVAPVELYRAHEKLFYRFICEVPVFAYDDQQTLSLNSCNIVIPKIPGLSVKYVLAILNSTVVAFYAAKKFNSIKQLRSHLEQIPIPTPNSKEQQAIVAMVDDLLKHPSELNDLYTKLEDAIAKLYKLSPANRKVIASYVSGRNLFMASPEAR